MPARGFVATGFEFETIAAELARPLIEINFN
jgi:hypothetical protein